MSGEGVLAAHAATVRGDTLAFAEGEGVGEIAGRASERADVLAYLARKRATRR